jgi:tRNA A-37 threonylcarbamoyl transferase component Bud32
VDGKPLSKFIEQILRNSSSDPTYVTGYGRDLGMVHAAGFALGDAKAGNIVVKDDELYFTDLEQAVEDGDQPWDIAEFLYYAGKLSMKEDGIRVVADAFLDGYVETNGTENIAKAKASKYLTPFRPFLIPQVLKAIKGSLDSHAG